MNHEIIVTADGSHTLFLPEMNEQYHSVNGAIAESNHVFIKNGYQFHKKANPVIFEVGFGTGLNCLLTALEAIKQKRFTRYISVEKFPLDKKIIYQLNYGKLISKKASELYNKIHEANWNEWKSISKYFQLKKIETDIIEMNFLDLEKFDIIYFQLTGKIILSVL